MSAWTSRVAKPSTPTGRAQAVRLSPPPTWCNGSGQAILSGVLLLVIPTFFGDYASLLRESFNWSPVDRLNRLSCR